MDKTSLLKGHLEMCVLSILSDAKSYGYEIMKKLEEHNLKLKGVSSIYPILTKLKDHEWVVTQRELTDNGKVRVYYKITEKGKTYLQWKIDEWMELQRDLTSLLQKHLEGE